MSDICPFCGRDPFHYVDNGVGMEAVAVTCCELGDAFYRGMRPAPEEITLSWEEFQEIGNKLAQYRSRLERSGEALDGAIVSLQGILEHPGEPEPWDDARKSLSGFLTVFEDVHQ